MTLRHIVLRQAWAAWRMVGANLTVGCLSV